MRTTHVTSEPAILYFGTPVALISTVNEDSSYNLAPMSSVFWLGWRCVLGLDASSKTPQNLIRTGECVVNLPSDNSVARVNRLALTTGTNPVPPRKAKRGYRYERNKFEIAGLTPVRSQTVAAPRVLECPVQLEAVLAARNDLAADDDKLRGFASTFELRIQRVHLDRTILIDGERNRVDPDKWRPLIMSFQKFYALRPDPLHPSRLSEIPESSYRTLDVDRARALSHVAAE